MWWEFRFFQELLPGVFYKTDGCFVAFYFHCDDFIICPPAAPLPTRRNRHTCTPHGFNPWVPISYSGHFGVAATLYIKYPSDVRDPTLSIKNFTRHRKRRYPSLPSQYLPLSRPRRRKCSSGSSYYHYSCARAKHQLCVFGFGLSIGRFF